MFMAIDFSALANAIKSIDWATASEAFRKIVNQDKVLIQEGRCSLSAL
jgi:hypothetical protein